MPRITASRRITPALNSIRSPGPDVLARLGRRAVELHAPAADRVDGERARLDQARGPQPLVDPDRLEIHPHIVPDLRRAAALCGHEEIDRTGWRWPPWRWSRPPPTAKRRSKVYTGDFTLVGTDGDYVTGKFGKVHLVDGKRNDKLSVHVRRLAKRTTYTFKLQTGSCGGAEVTGWTYRKLKTSRKGVGNSSARSKTFKVVKGTKYFVSVYGPDDQLVVCARLSSKGKSHPQQVARRQAARQERRRPRQGRGQAARQER